MDHFILRDKTAIPASWIEWAMWLENATVEEKRVAAHYVFDHWISTVWHPTLRRMNYEILSLFFTFFAQKVRFARKFAMEVRILINFADEHLIAKYGSWIRVQVAFYDFIFQTALDLCPKHFKDISLQQSLDGFADGEEFYERSIKAIEGAFSSPEEAWQAFLQSEKLSLSEILISLTDTVFILNEALLAQGDIETLNHTLWDVNAQRDDIRKAFSQADFEEYDQLFKDHDFDRWPKLYGRVK